MCRREEEREGEGCAIISIISSGSMGGQAWWLVTCPGSELPSSLCASV